MRDVLTMVDRVADSDVSVLLSRRERRRQGSDRARAAPAVGAAHQAVRQGQLRGAAGRAARERAVRPRARRVHRRAGDARRQVRVRRAAARSCSTRSARCRRRCRPSCCTCCRIGEFTQLGSNRPVEVDVRVIAATNRDLDDDDPRGHVPRGSVLPAAGHRDPRAAAARAPRRDPGARRVLPAAVRGTLRPAAAAPSPALRDALVRLPLAGQRPRAREHDEALRDPAGRGADARGAATRARSADRAGSRHAGRAGGRAGRARRRGGAAARAARPGAAPATPSVEPHAAVKAAKLPDLARAAALSAEREAIQQRARSLPLESPQGRRSTWASATRRC